MLKIAICDDSPLFLEQAVIMIREWATERQLPIQLYSCEYFNPKEKTGISPLTFSLFSQKSPRQNAEDFVYRLNLLYYA